MRCLSHRKHTRGVAAGTGTFRLDPVQSLTSWALPGKLFTHLSAVTKKTEETIASPKGADGCEVTEKLRPLILLSLTPLVTLKTSGP